MSYAVSKQAALASKADHRLSLSWRIGIAAFLIVEVILAFAPLAILGPAIGWPASLRNSAAQQMVAIASEPTAVTLGYGLYLGYSVAILPVAIIVAWRVTGLRGKLSALIIGLGALSALSRVIGILRWLTVMPLLAGSYATSDVAQRASIELTFSAINSYGGGIGEVLGVALFGGLWLFTAMIAALVKRSLPLWLTLFGFVAALLQLVLALPAFGVSVQIPVAIAVTTFVVWLTALAVYVMFKPDVLPHAASN